MIPEQYKRFTNINTDSAEGKLLIVALGALTSIGKEDIHKGKYGGMNDPDDVVERIWEISNSIFHKEEFEQWKLIEKRNSNIQEIFSEIPLD